MKRMAQSSAFGLLLFFAATVLWAQSPPDLRFGGHSLGETAETFFTTARVSESKLLARDYCKSLLEDPRTKEKTEDAKDSINKTGVFVLNKKDFSLLDVSNCQQVLAALQGQNAKIGARLASELGKGSALFASGKLMAFNLFWDSTYPDAVANMEKRFGIPGQKYSMPRSGGSVVREEIRWEKEGVAASVFENPSAQDAIVFVGFSQPPYDALLRGNPATQTTESLSAPAGSNALCESAPSEPGEQREVSGGVMTGLLIRRVQPIYPESAKQNHIEGTVTLQAVVDKCGNVAGLTPVSGPPELFQATVSAVQQWQYRAFLVAGQPTEVATRITVNFKLSH